MPVVFHDDAHGCRVAIVTAIGQDVLAVRIDEPPPVATPVLITVFGCLDQGNRAPRTSMELHTEVIEVADHGRAAVLGVRAIG